MNRSISACSRALASVWLIAGLGALIPAATSADMPTAPQPTPAQQTLIELHECVGAGWWSPVSANPPAMPASTPRARQVPAQWTVPSSSGLAPRARDTAL
jgi:hypothetical protein